MNFVLLMVGVLVIAKASSAHDEESLSASKLQNGGTPSVSRLNSSKNFAAVSSHDVAMAACPKAAPSTQEMIAWLANQFSRQPRMSQNIQGVAYANQPQELLEIWDEMIGYKVQEPDPPYAPKPLKISGCQDVFCAATQVFGKDLAVRMLYVRSRFGLQLSPYATQSQVVKNWTVSELDTLILALQDVPQFHFPLRGTSRYLFRRSDNGGTKEASLGLGVFDLWAIQGTPHSRRATMYHELGHVLGENTFDNSNEWNALAGWSPVSGKSDQWKTTNPERIISLYGETNPAEDFAESFAAYRYAPARLKAMSPKKYGYMKWYVFGGIEYLDANQCGVGQNQVRALNEEYVRSIEKGEVGVAFRPQAIVCAEKWKAVLKNLDKISKPSIALLSSCISNEQSKEEFPKWLAHKLKDEVDIDTEVFSMTRAMAPEGIMGANSKKLKDDLKVFIRDVQLELMSKYFRDNFLEFKKPDPQCVLDAYVSSNVSTARVAQSAALSSLALNLRSDLAKMAQRSCENIKSKLKKLPPSDAELKGFLETQLELP